MHGAAMSVDPADGHVIADDGISDTIGPVLQRMAREQVPVTVDTERKRTEWHRAHPDHVEIPRAVALAAAARLGRELGLRLALAARPRVRVGRRHNRFVIET
jgi:hypothetical protein